MPEHFKQRLFSNVELLRQREINLLAELTFVRSALQKELERQGLVAIPAPREEPAQASEVLDFASSS